ncbi:HNH endonuclease [Marininema mesophilum]|uniref:HNH endonuclease n=1 Tax=Marininema mesophilum TaxID=1048340 RepID=UPI00115FD0B8|nr:HNH endonuclease [Marininema mesophilum]
MLGTRIFPYHFQRKNPLLLLADLFWDKDNWQSLCKRCHDRKTAIEDGRWG